MLRIKYRMSNEEPSQTLQEQPLATSVVTLPVQASSKPEAIPRSLSCLHLIHQWQPMGIRVTLKPPFVGNDWGALFVIRNGPLVPRYGKPVYSKNGHMCSRYAYNNTRNVYLQPAPDFKMGQLRTSFPADYKITCSTYDHPSVLSTLSQCFRRWRGDMQYRIRVVAGFATQGYLIGTIVKNEVMPVGIYDEFNETPILTRNDFSYREMMTHGYLMSDTSMFRHLEVTVPYDYPTPFYDQYDWLAHRIQDNFIGGKVDFSSTVQVPCGDNFVFIGLRGAIDTPSNTEMQFELEYRALEGFQFAEPGYPPYDAMYTRASHVVSKAFDLTLVIPDKTKKSNGIDKIISPTVISVNAGPSTTTEKPVPERRKSPPYLPAYVEQLVKTKKPDSSSSSGITYPHGHKLGPFNSVATERRAGVLMTHAQRADGTWISWKGDVRPYIQAAMVEEDLWYNTQLTRITEQEIKSLIKRATREAEFS